MKLATTTGDFHAYVSESMDINAILPMMAESGFRYIDLSFYQADVDTSPIGTDNWEKWAEDAAACAEKLGLVYVQSHGSNMCAMDHPDYERRRELIRREMHICKRLGIPNIVVHGISRHDGTRESFVAENAALYKDLLRFSEETGVALLTENTCDTNCPTYFLFTAGDFHILDKAVGNHPLFGICWDVGHACIQGVDQYKELTELGKRLMAVHIHDNLGKRKSPSFMDFHMQPYSGSCGFDAIVKALADMNFPGPFTLEANAIPEPAGFLGRKPFEKDGVVYDRLVMLPLSFKIRSEKLMYDISRHMLESYDCFEE
ncbi:MAG: sugar phosphate isomerase/epimerase [Clostridia bacterium]|nr:sugar phosphate isomerase/epimerase [Clostridia bacterium]